MNSSRSQGIVTYQTLLYKFIYGKCTYFAQALQKSATFQPHNTLHRIFPHTIKLWLLFIDTATNTVRKVTNYVAKQSVICLCGELIFIMNSTFSHWICPCTLVLVASLRLRSRSTARLGHRVTINKLCRCSTSDEPEILLSSKARDGTQLSLQDFTFKGRCQSYGKRHQLLHISKNLRN